MTAEGYDYEYTLTTSIHDEWGYGSYSSTTGTFAIEVTVDPPAWTCGSCRDMRFMSGHAVHVTRQRGRSTSTHLAPGMIGPEWVRRPQSAADHVTGISAAGPDDRPSAKRPRSSSARSLATARTQTEGACGALRLGVPAASLFFPSSEAIAAGYTDGERTFAGGPPGPNGKSVVSTPLPSKDLSTGEAGATGTVDWV